VCMSMKRCLISYHHTEPEEKNDTYMCIEYYFFLCLVMKIENAGGVAPFFCLYFASLSQYVHSPIFFLPTHKKRRRFFFGICSVFFRYLSD